MMAQDDVGNRAVALDPSHELRALLRMKFDDLPLVVRELAIRDENGIREDELADVMEQAGCVDEFLLAFRETEETRDLAGVSSDGGGVASCHRVPHGERLKHGVDQTDLK